VQWVLDSTLNLLTNTSLVLIEARSRLNAVPRIYARGLQFEVLQNKK